MSTYWCNARCAFCYVHGSAERGGRMEPREAVEYWRQLERVAGLVGKRLRVHITGGEPFGDWENLLAIVRAVKQAGLGPLEKIETNGFWARDEAVVAERLTALRRLGLRGLVVSTDVYHQRFVEIERVRRCVRIARQVLGAERVEVRWAEDLAGPVEPLAMEDVGAAYRRAYGRHRDRLTGRAAFEVAVHLDRWPAEALERLRCKRQILKSRHIHIDPHGNVFAGVCSGIVLGKARDEPLDRMWQRLSRGWRDHPVLEAVVRAGPCELLRLARQGGYEPLPGGYAGKCHLCTDVRQWLFERGGWEGYLGPAECYLLPEERRAADGRGVAAVADAGRRWGDGGGNSWLDCQPGRSAVPAGPCRPG